MGTDRRGGKGKGHVELESEPRLDKVVSIGDALGRKLARPTNAEVDQWYAKEAEAAAWLNTQGVALGDTPRIGMADGNGRGEMLALVCDDLMAAAPANAIFVPLADPETWASYRGAEATLWRAHEVASTEGTVYVCDDPLDALTLIGVGELEVVTVPTHRTRPIGPAAIDHLKGVKKVVLVHGQEPWRKRVAADRARQLGLERAWRVEITAPLRERLFEPDERGIVDPLVTWTIDYARKAGQFDVSGVRSTTAVLQDLYDEKLLDDGAVFVDWPWPGFGELIGRLKPPRYMGLAARAKTGKTTAAAEVALHNARLGRPVLFAEFDMSQNELMSRIVQAEFGVDSAGVTTAVLDEARERLAGYPLYLWADQGLRSKDLPAVLETARQASRRYAIRLFILDHFHKLIAGCRSFETESVTATTSSELQKLASDEGLILLSLTQPRRGDDDVGFADQKYSGALEADQDTIIVMNRKRKREQKLEDDGRLIGAFHPLTKFEAMGRYAPGGVQYLMLEEDVCRFRLLSAAEVSALNDQLAKAGHARRGKKAKNGETWGPPAADPGSPK